jgi:hypothetical protein
MFSLVEAHRGQNTMALYTDNLAYTSVKRGVTMIFNNKTFAFIRVHLRTH